jgi:hypothetical protein
VKSIHAGLHSRHSCAVIHDRANRAAG